MAEVTVRKRDKKALVLWLVALLVVAAWLMYELTPRFTGAQSRARIVTPVIVDFEVLVTANKDESLIGREVAVRNVIVTSVTGDRTFWVTSANKVDPVFVVLNQQQTPGTPTEGRYDVKAGQTLDINGSIERFPGWEVARDRWGADPALPFQDQRFYIAAKRLNITDRP